MYGILAGTTAFLALFSSVLTKNHTDDMIVDLNTFNGAIYNIFGHAKTRNLFCFPFPILAGLTLIYHGTRGASAKEISHSLFSVNNTKAYNEMINSFKRSSNITMDFNNIFLFKRKAAIKQSYIKILKQYSTDVKFVDLSKLQQIWNNKITLPVWAGRKNFIQDTCCILVTKAQFKSPWKVPFSPSDTTREDEIFMMHIYNGLFKLTVSSYLDSTVLEIPLSGDRFSMIYILPMDENGLQQNIEAKLYDTEAILEIVTKMKRRFMRHVSVPKFRFQSDMGLEQVVYELQIKTIFTTNANFSAVTPQRIYIKQGLHTAMVEVDEKGVRSSSYVLTVINEAIGSNNRATKILTQDPGSRPTRKPIQRPTTRKATTMPTYRTHPTQRRKTHSRRFARASFRNAYRKSDEFLAVYPFAFLLFDYHLNMIVSFGKFSNFSQVK